MATEWLLPLAGFAWVTCITPGPNNVLLTASGARFGFRRTLPHVLGISAGMGLMLMLVAMGLGALFQQRPLLQTLLTWGGVAFLLLYGGRSLLTAWRGSGRSLQAENGPDGRRDIILTTLAVTLLNPHVYLDTVMILGSVSTQWPSAALPLFACGAVLASTVWFYGLALLAARLSPWLARPLVQRLIDGLVGSIMWGIALLLVAQALAH